MPVTRKTGDASIVTYSPELETWIKNISSLAGNAVVQRQEKKHIAQWFANLAINSFSNCIRIEIQELSMLSVGYTYDADVPNAKAMFVHKDKRGETGYTASIYFSTGWDDYFEWDVAANVHAEKMEWMDGKYYPGKKGVKSY